jgi:integrase
MALTDSWLKAHHKKPHEKTTEKADGEGLSVRVSPAGKIVFQMRYRVLGKSIRLDLGTYPLMPLKDARVEHQRLKAMWDKGYDPKVMKRVEAVSHSELMTNKQLYLEWHRLYATDNLLSADTLLRSFEMHVFPVLGDLPAGSTSAHTWMTVIEGLVAERPAVAERVFHLTKQVHKWACRRGLLAVKPLEDITSSELRITKTESGRALSDEEINLVWHSVDKSRALPSNKLFVKLCLVFGCRNGELRSCDPVTEMDFNTMLWTIPPEKNKVRKVVAKSIVRPILPEVLPLLREAMELSNSPRRLFTQYAGIAPLSNGSSLSLPYTVMDNAMKHFGITMQHWSMHDLRKTARTNFSTLTSVHVAEVMLGHTLKGMQGVYDRHLYIEEQTMAYRAWWNRLQEIVAVPPPTLYL